MIMFTGIITSTGKIKKIEQNTKNRSAIKVSVDPVSYTHLTLPTKLLV